MWQRHSTLPRIGAFMIMAAGCGSWMTVRSEAMKVSHAFSSMVSR